MKQKCMQPRVQGYYENTTSGKKMHPDLSNYACFWLLYLYTRVHKQNRECTNYIWLSDTYRLINKPNLEVAVLLHGTWAA